MGETEIKKNEQNYPSSGLAYDIALASYETMLKRLEFVEARLQTTLTYAATLTVAVPAVASAKGIPLTSNWLVTALVAFIIAAGLGTFARWVGEVKLLNPTLLFDEWLCCTAWEFKTDMVFYAGKHFEANRALIQKKWRLAILTSVIFFLEFLCLTVWMAKAHASH